MSNRRKTRPSVCAADQRRFMVHPPRYRSRGAGIPYALVLPGPRREPKRLRDRRAKARRKR